MLQRLLVSEVPFHRGDCNVVYVAWRAQRIEACKHVKVVSDPIVIEESPLDTRSARLMTSDSHRRMNQSDGVRKRGGRRRHGVHKRKVTLTFDPATPDHCGFACLLKAAGVRVTQKNIEDLRKHTAAKVYTAYLSNESVHDMNIRDMVEQTDDTLAAYLAKLRWNMWASPAELCFAADVLGIDLQYRRGMDCWFMGRGLGTLSGSQSNTTHYM